MQEGPIRRAWWRDLVCWLRGHRPKPADNPPEWGDSYWCCRCWHIIWS